MKPYIVIHEHAYGVTGYSVFSDKCPTVRQVVRCLGIDFEPSRGESITISDITPGEPVILNWKDEDALEFEEQADEEDSK